MSPDRSEEKRIAQKITCEGNKGDDNKGLGQRYFFRNIKVCVAKEQVQNDKLSE